MYRLSPMLWAGAPGPAVLAVTQPSGDDGAPLRLPGAARRRVQLERRRAHSAAHVGRISSGRDDLARLLQKVAPRLSLTLETAAVQQMRKTGSTECRCIPDAEQLMAQHVLIAVEVLSTWSTRRDRVHKMSDYADAGYVAS